MQPSTGPEGATSGQSNSLQGASEPCSGGSYGAPPVRSTGGRAPCPTDSRTAAALNAAELKSPAPAPKSVREPSIVRLEAVGREESLKAWGINPSARWSEAERRPRHSDELDGHEHDADAVDGEGRELEELGFLLDGGWTAVDSTRGSRGWTPGARDAGMTSHRGVLHPGEHVDEEALRAALEAELGFTLDDVRAVFRQGRKSSAQLELRERIDARLLEVADAGGNLLELAKAFGWAIEAADALGGERSKTMERAIERARERSATS